MRYLVYTPKFGLWFLKVSTFELIGYFDADWAGCKIDRKSTSGACQFLAINANSRAHSAIIHRTVRCDTELSGEPAE
jgi:hypothetical protein